MHTECRHAEDDGPSRPEESVLTSLRGGGKGKGAKGKGKGAKGRGKEDLGVPKDPQMSSAGRQHAGEHEHEFEQDSNSDVDVDVDAGLEGDDDGDGVLDVMARFHGERKKDCKFIIVTGE